MDASPERLHSIFMNYRRQDVAFFTGWLYEHLCSTFGSTAVFKDIDSIHPGEDFSVAIEAAIRACHTVLVVIGPRWLTMLAEGRAERRIDLAGDFVRIEIETAFQYNSTVIPILVEDAVMPLAAELPASIRPLARRHAVRVSPTNFTHDTKQIIEEVKRVQGAAAQIRWKAEAKEQAENRVHKDLGKPLTSPTPRTLYSGERSVVGLETRIGTAERAEAQMVLNEHLKYGRLTIEEYSQRSALSANAKTAFELESLFSDLPSPRPKSTHSAKGRAKWGRLMWGRPKGKRSSYRVGNSERAEAQKALSDHQEAGRLEGSEYLARRAAAAAATTSDDLFVLFADLPAPHPLL